MKTGNNSIADIEFQVKWKSSLVSHKDGYFGRNINFWRDCFTPGLYEILQGKSKGERAALTGAGGEFIEPYQENKVFQIKRSRFGKQYRNGSEIIPRAGRFYPKGLLRDMPGVFPQNMEPFRCLKVLEDHITVDFNHPLSRYDMNLELLVKDVRDKDREKGGSCSHWIEIITAGPGMQARFNGNQTDFDMADAFSREDESPDSIFYEKPRMVYHIDETARSVVRDLYSKLLKPGMRVLDLMASMDSHVDSSITLQELTGLGLNRLELEANRQLSSFHVVDLNESPALPYEAASFDSVICTSSVEYLTNPSGVFQEVSRVLRPGGVFILTFSNRWFPPKVVKIWKEIHEFERVGLVTEYFLKNRSFENIETFSMRGLPRPTDDKYFPEYMDSDPVFGVWAWKK